jgi:hypothetical protein
VSAQLTYDALVRFHRDRYAPSNCILLSYGDLPPPVETLSQVPPRPPARPARPCPMHARRAQVLDDACQARGAPATSGAPAVSDALKSEMFLQPRMRHPVSVAVTGPEGTGPLRPRAFPGNWSDGCPPARRPPARPPAARPAPPRTAGGQGARLPRVPQLAVPCEFAALPRRAMPSAGRRISR